MARTTDANEVRLTGENSFIRLFDRDGGTETTRASHWRILLSPGGRGPALFIQSDATDGKPRVYSDNIAVARYLQEELESMLFPAFADTSLPVIRAKFRRSGDIASQWTESVRAADESVILNWYDFCEPFVINVPPGARPLGVISTFVPAKKAQVTVGGRVASGAPSPDKRDDYESSTACLAWSETWLRPR